jgi:hypothetical protein
VYLKKNEFVELFRKHLELSAQIAENNIGHPISRNIGILRDSPFPNGRRISIEQAADELFISEMELFRIIDLAVVEVSPTTTWVWVRESGHKTTDISKTWNQPLGSGPFKEIVAKDIRIIGK